MVDDAQQSQDAPERKTRRPGQAALEYLVTYGWAILVVLVAVAALAYFGIIDTGRWAPSSFTMSDGFSAAEFKVDGGGGAFSLFNNIGEDVSILGYTMTSTSPTGCDASRTFVTPISVSNGDKYTITLDCDAAPGEKVKGTVELVYQLKDQEVTHTAKGDFSLVVEGGEQICVPQCDGCSDDDGCGGTCEGQMCLCPTITSNALTGNAILVDDEIKDPINPIDPDPIDPINPRPGDQDSGDLSGVCVNGNCDCSGGASSTDDSAGDDTCTPSASSCDGKQCNALDDCGDPCGCDDGFVCRPAGICPIGGRCDYACVACEPSCDGTTCGSDGCDGTCSCDEGTTCDTATETCLAGEVLFSTLSSWDSTRCVDTDAGEVTSVQGTLTVRVNQPSVSRLEPDDGDLTLQDPTAPGNAIPAEPLPTRNVDQYIVRDFSFTDSCTDSWNLTEYYCNGNVAGSSTHSCPCANGACIQVENATCTDSDGASTTTKGTVTLTSGTQTYTFTDSSPDSVTVKEAVCVDGTVSYSVIVCGAGQFSYDGKCVAETGLQFNVPSTTVLLAKDYTFAGTTPMFTVTADDVTIDCQGHRVTLTGTSGYFVKVVGTSTKTVYRPTVKNCLFTSTSGYGQGFLLTYTKDGVIENNQFSILGVLNGAADGYLFQGNSFYVLGQNVLNFNGGSNIEVIGNTFVGLYATSTQIAIQSGQTVQGLVVSENIIKDYVLGNGINVYSPGAIVDGNTISTLPDGDTYTFIAINLNANSVGTQVTNNVITLSSNNDQGISVSSGATPTNLLIEGNEISGIAARGISISTLTNTVNANTFRGISTAVYLSSTASNNIISANTITDVSTTTYGAALIDVLGTNNQLLNNEITNFVPISTKATVGIRLQTGAIGNLVQGNTISAATTIPDAIAMHILGGSTGNTVKENLFDTAFAKGLYLVGDSNVIQGNTFNSPTEYAIYVTGDGNTLDGNIVNNAAKYAFQGVGAVGGTIANNKFEQCPATIVKPEINTIATGKFENVVVNGNTLCDGSTFA